MAVRLPAFHSPIRSVAILARTSPFRLHGLKGVSSVIAPVTLPYMYTLSKKTSFAQARLQASMVLAMMRGHISAHNLWSYFRPASRYTTLEPDTARAVCSLSDRSADTISSAPSSNTGCRPTSLTARSPDASSLTSSLLMTPPAPRIVIMGMLLWGILKNRLAGHL